MKKLLALVLTVALVATLGISLAACNNDDVDAADLIVGAIMVGNETEGYTEAHMNGINDAVAAVKADLGKTVKIIWKKDVPETAECATAANECVAAGASLVLTNSYGHQFQLNDVIDANPNVTIVSMTGDLAKASGKANWKNAFTNVYESRYVSGIVAGLKLQALLDAGTVSTTATPNAYDGANIKIGYVGAYPYAEVVSGYTAFYLGLKSVVSNVVMEVQYTNEWFDFDAEKETAKTFINKGCVIIGQHADSEGAPTACEEAYNDGKVVYSVGYNVDMLEAAPHAALTSAANNWSVYYTYLFKAMLAGEEVATDWAEGYHTDAVAITALGNSCAAGTQTAVDAAVAAIKAGTLKVFDCASFTVGGNHVTTSLANVIPDDAYTPDTEAIVKEGDVYYFNESTLRSAPYFELRIDGISEIFAD